jgi:hypothetical protein
MAGMWDRVILQKKKASLHEILRRHGRWRACSEAHIRGYSWIHMYHNVENISRKNYAKIKNIGGVISVLKTTISKSRIIVDFVIWKQQIGWGPVTSNVDNTMSINPILINVWEKFQCRWIGIMMGKLLEQVLSSRD